MQIMVAEIYLALQRLNAMNVISELQEVLIFIRVWIYALIWEIFQIFSNYTLFQSTNSLRQTCTRKFYPIRRESWV